MRACSGYSDRGGNGCKQSRSPPYRLKLEQFRRRTSEDGDEFVITESVDGQRVADRILGRDRERIIRTEHDAVGADLADQVREIVRGIHDRVVVELAQVLARRLLDALTTLVAQRAVVRTPDV